MATNKLAHRTRIEVLRGVDSTSNVVQLFLQRTFADGVGWFQVPMAPVARVLSPGAVRSLAHRQRQIELRRLTRQRVANDTETGSSEIVLSVPMRRTMAVRGRLARIVAESQRVEAERAAALGLLALFSPIGGAS